MPIYRIRESDGEYELASGDEWIVSRAADVEAWFNEANVEKSPDTGNGRQFRRVVRHVKKFGRSRSAWKEEIAAGFTITKLVEECFGSDDKRDDIALRETLKSIHARLEESLEVLHPTTPGNCLADDRRPRKRPSCGISWPLHSMILRSLTMRNALRAKQAKPGIKSSIPTSSPAPAEKRYGGDELLDSDKLAIQAGLPPGC